VALAVCWQVAGVVGLTGKGGGGAGVGGALRCLGHKSMHAMQTGQRLAVARARPSPGGVFKGADMVGEFLGFGEHLGGQTTIARNRSGGRGGGDKSLASLGRARKSLSGLTRMGSLWPRRAAARRAGASRDGNATAAAPGSCAHWASERM
jgi:hypothetical protein